ncbi:cell division protein FtsL [Suttonella ornithocola]|uniref:Cell division protein n=1 Tax=Suttonella ornithocola TaxID=279832 RepID=A0A380MY70_9GAMM|nr:cell division protein FtsL [Suttonella ornithocola]SUO97242.1 Cell division protein [Suttonella ornithocola]
MKWFALLLVVLSAFAIVNGVKTAAYAQDHANLVSEVQSLKLDRDKLNSDWTQLLLEQKTLVNDHAIEKAIADGLNLHMPLAKQVVYLD